jgi:hypothetical protein
MYLANSNRRFVRFVDMKEFWRGKKMDDKQQATAKPKYQFCWHCGNKLRANFYREYKENGNTFIVHRQCYEVLMGEFPDIVKAVGDDVEIQFN